MMKKLILFAGVLACIGYATRTQAQCTEPLSVTIQGSGTGQPLSFVSASVTAPIPCFGGTATVTLVATGGTLDRVYTFGGNPPNNTGVFTNITAGNYSYTITDANNCGPITGMLNVPEPEEVTKSATAQQAVICSGANAVIDVTTTMVTPNKAFNWTAAYGGVTGGAGSGTSVTFGTGAINDGPLVNATNANIIVTYTITPYSFGLDGIDDNGTGDDCLGMPMDVTVTVEPTPTKMAAAQQALICSGSDAVIDVTTTLTTLNTRFKWSAVYGAVSGGAGSAASVPFGAGAITEALTNGTNADILVTYTITPYTFGPNGVDDGGNNDDCMGMAMDVTVTVEPTPTKTAVAQQSVICSGSNAVINVTTTLTTPNTRFKWSGSYGAVTGGNPNPMNGSVAFGTGAINDGPLVNATNADIVVTYTITPYTYGLNGSDDGGTGDDCLGAPMNVTVTVEPIPTKTATAQQAITCSSAVIDVTTTLATPNKAFKWSAVYGAVTGGANSAASVAFGIGAISEALTNSTNADILVTYTIIPYTFGPNGTDDGGTGDDCMGASMDVSITVEPTPTKTATAQLALICSGTNAVIDVTTTMTTPNKAFKWSAAYGAVTGGAGSATSVAYGVGAINDGPLVNATGSSIVVVYTITPYTFGPNGVDNGGSGDDCMGMSMDVNVTVNPKITAATCTPTNDLCQLSAGQVKVEASGGTAPLTITWTATFIAPFAGPATGTPAGTAQVVPPLDGFIIYSGLSGNTTYNFVVTDANGCQVP